MPRHLCISELRSIVLKTVGLADPLRDALKPLSKAIRAAFVYGSVAKATDQSASDIDLMIISDSLTYGEVFGALERVTRTVGRKINPTVYTAAEFSKRARTENAFVTRVLEQPKLWVIGSEDDLTIASSSVLRRGTSDDPGGSQAGGGRSVRNATYWVVRGGLARRPWIVHRAG